MSVERNELVLSLLIFVFYLYIYRDGSGGGACWRCFLEAMALFILGLMGPSIHQSYWSLLFILVSGCVVNLILNQTINFASLLLEK
jgi:hypothetical protein